MAQDPLSLLDAFRQRPHDARLALLGGAALEATGQEEKAVAVWTLGDDVNARLRTLHADASAAPQLREASAAADAAIRRWMTRLHNRAVDEFETDNGVGVDRVRNSVWPLTHDGAVEFRTPMQQPVIFYMPDLPASEVTPNESLPWVDGLQQAAPAIRREYDAAAAAQRAMTPYVPAETQGPKWRELRGKQDWSSFHLYRNAAPTAELEYFPETAAALEHVDLVRVDSVPMEAFFSRLRPGARIPPHYGLTNTRLTTHLPLIVPPQCGIRVGADTYGWREGEIIAFDDSYQHEAWNRSDTDRVVLIFEAHHPDLSEAERRAIEHVYAVRQHWLDHRRRLIGIADS